jgi:hypothetical protein
MLHRKNVHHDDTTSTTEGNCLDMIYRMNRM